MILLVENNKPDFKLLGLMLTRDNMPMLDHWLSVRRSQFDAIFGFDGSLDQAEETEVTYAKYGVDCTSEKDVEGAGPLVGSHRPRLGNQGCV